MVGLRFFFLVFVVGIGSFLLFYLVFLGLVGYGVWLRYRVLNVLYVLVGGRDF